MAKQEYDKTPLEVTKVATERLPTWALAVARMELDQTLGSNFQKNKPVEYEKLQNLVAELLVESKYAKYAPNRSNFKNTDDRRYVPSEDVDFGPMTVGLPSGKL